MNKKNALDTIAVSHLEQVREACREALSKNPLLTTDELKLYCRKARAFHQEMYNSAADAKETAAINQALGTLKDENGNRLVHSVRIFNPVTGETERHHYQESLFEISHYVDIIPKVGLEARAKTKKTKNLNDNCKRKFGVDAAKQLPFDFDAVCDAFELIEESVEVEQPNEFSFKKK
jgi:hypothetical protein